MSSTFGYDPVGRLLAITHAQGANPIDIEGYSYDPGGNRLSRATGIGQPLITQPTLNQFNGANQLLQFGSQPNQYDANGNLVQEGSSVAYTWDSRNRLKSIMVLGGQMTSFMYDFAGNMIAQMDSGPALNTTRYFVLDSITNLAYVSASDGSSYSVLAGRGIDNHLAITQSNGQVQYGLADGINSSVATLDQSGVLKARFVYEPYGGATMTGSYPFQFTGRTTVSPSINYHRARFYNTQAGRFISEDPLGFRGGDFNLYRYVRNRPIQLTDRSGLEPASCGDVVGLLCGIGMVPVCFGATEGLAPYQCAAGSGIVCMGIGNALCGDSPDPSTHPKPTPLTSTDLPPFDVCRSDTTVIKPRR